MAKAKNDPIDPIEQETDKLELWLRDPVAHVDQIEKLIAERALAFEQARNEMNEAADELSSLLRNFRNALQRIKIDALEKKIAGAQQ